MRNGVISPYGIMLREGGKVDTFPAVEVTLQSKKSEWFTLIFVIDSGATISALPETDGLALGLNVRAGPPIAVGGISGELARGWEHDVFAKIDGETSKLPIVFLENKITPRVLGRAGFFDKFTVIFEQAKNRTGLFYKHSKAATAVSKVLNSAARRKARNRKRWAKVARFE